MESPVKLKDVDQIKDLIHRYKEFSLGRFKKDAERLLQNWYMKVIPTPSLVSSGIIPAVQVGEEINFDTIQQSPRTPQNRKKARLTDEVSPARKNQSYSQNSNSDDSESEDILAKFTEQISEHKSNDDKENPSSLGNTRTRLNNISEDSISNQNMSESSEQDAGIGNQIHVGDELQRDKSKSDDQRNDDEKLQPINFSEEDVSAQTQGIELEGISQGEDEQQQESGKDLAVNEQTSDTDIASKDGNKDIISSKENVCQNELSKNIEQNHALSQNTGKDVEPEQESRVEDEPQRGSGDIDEDIDNDFRSHDSTSNDTTQLKGEVEKKKQRALSSRNDTKNREKSESLLKGKKRRTGSKGDESTRMSRRKRAKPNYFQPKYEGPRLHHPGNDKGALFSQETSQSIENDSSYQESSSQSEIMINRVHHQNRGDAEIPDNVRGQVSLSVQEEPLTMDTFPVEDGNDKNANQSSSSSTNRANRTAIASSPIPRESQGHNDSDDSLRCSGAPTLSEVPNRAIVSVRLPSPPRHIPTQPRAKRMWTQVEKDAIKDGIVKYGVGKWVDIKDEYTDVLNNRSNTNIKVR